MAKRSSTRKAKKSGKRSTRRKETAWNKLVKEKLRQGLAFGDALKGSGEQMWRMPLLEELKDQLKSDCADLKHTGDRWGGAITAALFLREFIGDTKNWVHADIAGPAMSDRASGWASKGGTGHGVLTFYKLVEQAQQAALAAPAAPAAKA